MRTLIPLVVVLSLGLMGCAPKKIPGTELDDTSDTRAVLDVIQKYRSAFEGRNVDALVKLADKTFRDNGGSSTPEDDFDYESLASKMSVRFSKVADLHLDVTVRRIEFDDDAKKARVTYTYQMSFKMPEYSGRTQTENDIKQMYLLRVGEQEWKITSGI